MVSDVVWVGIGYNLYSVVTCVFFLLLVCETSIVRHTTSSFCTVLIAEWPHLSPVTDYCFYVTNLKWGFYAQHTSRDYMLACFSSGSAINYFISTLIMIMICYGFEKTPPYCQLHICRLHTGNDNLSVEIL